jgi:hypothetical protein
MNQKDSVKGDRIEKSGVRPTRASAAGRGSRPTIPPFEVDMGDIETDADAGEDIQSKMPRQRVFDQITAQAGVDRIERDSLTPE